MLLECWRTCIQDTISSRACMQDTFARATHSAYAAGRPSAARDDRVSCIQVTRSLGLAFRPSARASKGILHTTEGFNQISNYFNGYMVVQLLASIDIVF